MISSSNRFWSSLSGASSLVAICVSVALVGCAGGDSTDAVEGADGALVDGGLSPDGSPRSDASSIFNDSGTLPLGNDSGLGGNDSAPPSCSPSCGFGVACGSNADCASLQCTAGKCAAASCAPSCTTGTACGANADCVSGTCTNGSCALPTCSPTCPVGHGCTAASDCASGVCTNGSCVSPGADAGHDGGTGTMDASADVAPPPVLSLPGVACNVDTDCQSQLCKPVVIGVGPVCVTSCTQQSDCAAEVNSFCEPITAGSTAGYCIPQSPAHCLSCTKDSDCGSLSEACFEAPGDNALACNIDCSIAGAAACPSDYSCVAETVSGASRMLCRPNTIPTCLDAVGGFCDRLTIPQACERINSAGDCFGQRTCMESGRYGSCGAAGPQCKTDCSIQDPVGCMESYCSSAIATPTNCGACGTVCPGYLEPNDNVTCQNSATCTFSCQGENYDVNNSAADGCEVADSPTGNHTKATAANEGSVSDCDSNFSYTGHLVSDKQVHASPAIVGFDTTSGSAPDWTDFTGVGHDFCENDIDLTLTVTGSASPGCYEFTVITDKNTYVCQTNGQGTCGFNDSEGQFSDNTIIYVEVQKTCTATVIENVSYTVSGHL
jgi:hypothetical protein